MKPVPTPEGTSPAPTRWARSGGTFVRFCTITLAGRTMSATATMFGAPPGDAALLAAATGTGDGVGADAAGDGRMTVHPDTNSAAETTRATARAGLCATRIDAAPCFGGQGLAMGAVVTPSSVGSRRTPS